MGGVCPAARAVALVALASEAAPTVAVVPSERDAEELIAALELVAPEITAAALPAEAVEAYVGRTPPLGATAAAATALLGLATGTVRVLAVPARLLPYPLPPPGSLRSRCPALHVGQTLDPHEFARALADAGYRRVEVVEEAGDFAVRGQVLDLGTPERFLRVLLDVDRVEALRQFDPATQRSGDPVRGVTVPPLRLFSTDEPARAAVARKLDDQGCRAAATAALAGGDAALW